MKNILLLAIIALMFTTGCVQLDKPNVEYVDYRLGTINTEGVEVNFIFDVGNPNPIDINISNYSYDIYINNKKILKQTGSGFTLNANKTKRITLPVLVRYEGVFGAAISIIESLARGEKEMDYRVEGSISAGAMGLTTSAPIAASGKIKIPTNIKL
jgi:LEA14-like dessication related protein